MGCITSKFLSTTDLDQGLLFYDNNHKSNLNTPHHLVSLTSSTYGALNLDHHDEKANPEAKPEEVLKKISEWKKRSSPALTIPIFKKRVADEEPAEIINTWELMKDLGCGEDTPIWSPLKKKHIKSRSSPAVADIAAVTPMKHKTKLAGKENKISPLRQVLRRSDTDPSRVLRPFSPLENMRTARNSDASSRSKRSLAPIFDPELVASFEQEICEQEEQIKKMVAPTTINRKTRDSSLLLQSFEEKCPPGGANAVILYTTTLRGIRKTFEDCNVVRALIESCDVQIVERDISMDSGFREELRVLMGRKEVRVPLLFVKGRLIGSTEEVLKLDEEAKLGLLMEGIPAAGVWCEGCAGVRFVMCADCSGSCKVLDEEQKKTVRCGECNENGLIHCPICS